MKRSSSSDSMAGSGDMGLIQLCPPDEKRVYRRLGSFQSILDGVDEGADEMLGEGEDELGSPGAAGGAVDSFGSAEKKRRLSTEQVKALEKYFEVENKLEPERKAKLAQELGLQPRQVAVWFQNRRARWKTKQLERDFGALKASYDNLRQDYDALRNEKESLLAELKELKAKLAADGGESSYCSIKEEAVAVSEDPVTEQKPLIGEEAEDDGGEEDVEPPALIYKDGSSESDSSAILNGDTSPHHFSGTAISSSSGVLFDHHSLHEELDQPQQSLFLGFNCNPSSASSPSFHCPDPGRNNRFGYYYCPQQTFKVEEHGFFGAEDPSAAACLFTDEPPPNLPWYCADQWN